MRILTVIDGIVKDDDKWLWRYLPQNDHDFDFVCVNNRSRSRPRYLGSLFYYSRYAWLGLKALLRASSYDVVVSWEAKCGLPFAFLQSVLRRSRPPHVILGFIGKNAVRRVPWLCRFALRSISKLVVYSSGEVREYEKLLSVPRGKIVFTPLADFYSVDALLREPTSQSRDYIFTVGSSNRDYRCLAEAVRGLNARTIIVGKRSDFVGIGFPENVELRYELYGPALDKLMRESRLVIIPLRDPEYSAGQTVLLKAMTFGKPVIVSRTAGTADYLEHGKNGLLVTPGDVQELRSAIQYLLENGDNGELLGKNAQRSALERFSREEFACRVLAILENVHDGKGAALHGDETG